MSPEKILSILIPFGLESLQLHLVVANEKRFYSPLFTIAEDTAKYNAADWTLFIHPNWGRERI